MYIVPLSLLVSMYTHGCLMCVSSVGPAVDRLSATLTSMTLTRAAH